MHEDSKIFFKLELIKQSKNITVNLHFNQHAENITCDNQTITWSPTKEEQSFLFEALQLVKHQNINNTIVFNKNTQKTTPKDQLEKTTPDEPWDSIDKLINKKASIHS